MYNSDHSTPNAPADRGNPAAIRVGVGDHHITLHRWPGDGPEVLLIHGISSSGESWRPVLAALGEHLTPVTIDLRGHGHSARPDSGYLYEDYAADLDAALAHLGLDHPLVIGHSLGGLVALWWASQHPDRARALVIEDSPLRSGEDFRSTFDAWIAQNAMPVEELAAAYREKNPALTVAEALRRATIMTGTAREVFTELREDSLANHGTDRIALFERIKSPILFISGDPASGGMVHPDDLAAFSRRVPHVEVAQVAGAGHSIHAEHPGTFVDLVVPFLQRHAHQD